MTNSWDDLYIQERARLGAPQKKWHLGATKYGALLRPAPLEKS